MHLNGYIVSFFNTMIKILEIRTALGRFGVVCFVKCIVPLHARVAAWMNSSCA